MEGSKRTGSEITDSTQPKKVYVQNEKKKKSAHRRVPHIYPWRANLLQSLATTLIKLTYLWFSNDLEDSD